MGQLTIPKHSQVLFEAFLEPVDSAIDKLRKERGAGDGEINLFRGKKNKLAAALYGYENLINRMEQQIQEVSYDINKEKDKYDFHYDILSCSFLPDKDCRFDWARFGIELDSKSNSGEPSDIKPVAYYLFPSEVKR